MSGPVPRDPVFLTVAFVQTSPCSSEMLFTQGREVFFFHTHILSSHFSTKPGIKNVASTDKSQEISELRLEFCL